MASTILQFSGAALITLGAALVFPPAGLIVGGLFVVLIGMALGN